MKENEIQSESILTTNVETDLDQESKKDPLPDFETFDEDDLKKSYDNPMQYVHALVTGMPKKDSKAYMKTEAYVALDSSEDESALNRASSEYPIGELPRAGASPVKVYHIVDENAYQELRQKTVELSDSLMDVIEKRLSSSDAQRDYANSLYGEVTMESERLEKLKEEVRRTDSELLGLQDQIKEMNDELERLTPLFNNAQNRESIKQLQDRIVSLEEEIRNLPEGSTNDNVFNPFAAGSERRQKEMQLENARKDLEESLRLQSEINRLREQIPATQKQYDERFANTPSLKMAQERFDRYREQVEMDSNADQYEEHRAKAHKFLAATGPNRLKRWADGYTNTYMATKTPFPLGALAMGPVLDVSSEKDIVGKVAASKRQQFPIYDCVIQADAVEQTLVDFWKDKEKGKMDAAGEELMRRKLYDHVSQLEVLLDQVYETSLDPEKSQKLKELQFTDPGNDPFHMHERAARGSAVLRSAAEAYRVGLENNWSLEDMATMSTFNYVRRKANCNTLSPGKATDLKNHLKSLYQDPPVYKDEEHKKWVEDLNEYWKKMETIPLTNKEQRQERIEQMHELIRVGFEKKYIDAEVAKNFNLFYQEGKKKDLLIEQGKEPAFFEVKNLKTGRELKDLKEELKAAEDIDYKKIEAAEQERLKEEEKKNKKEDKEKPAEESTEPDTEFFDDSLDQSFYGAENSGLTQQQLREYAKDAEPGEDITQELFGKKSGREKESGIKTEEGDSIPVDVEFEMSMKKFMTTRSSVFMGRESEEHKNLREAMIEMQELKEKLARDNSRENLENFIEKTDEVIYRSRVYQEAKGNANTPAGKERLQGAMDIEKYAQKELFYACKTYSKENDVAMSIARIRGHISDHKSSDAVMELQNAGKPVDKASREHQKEVAATILVNNFSKSEVKFNQKGFQLMGANAIKKDILASKEFHKVMNTYFDNPNIRQEDMVAEIASGKTAEKMSKLHRQLNEKSKQQEKAMEKRADKGPRVM